MIRTHPQRMSWDEAVAYARTCTFRPMTTAQRQWFDSLKIREWPAAIPQDEKGKRK